MEVSLDLLQETQLLGCKPVRTLMDIDADLWDETGPLFEDVSQYGRLVGKLIYLTITRPNIACAVGLLSQFMHKAKESHWKAALIILTYIKGSSDKDYCIKSMDICRLKLFSDLNYIGERENLLLATVFILEVICLFGRVRSKMLRLVPVLKQSI